MTATRPEVRALHLQMLLGAVEALGEAPARAVRAAVHERTLARVEAAGRLEWLPADLLNELCDAVWVAGGADGAEGWGAAALDRAVHGHLARAFYEAGLALGGRDPGTIVSHLVHVWPLLYRGCGHLVVTDASADAFRVMYVEVPAALRRAQNLVPVQGALVSIARACGRDARGGADWSPESATCAFTVRWA